MVTVRRQVGAGVKRGQVVALLESAKWLNPVRSLFSGRVAEVNDEVLKRPSLINEGFYNTGWLLRLLPSDPDEHKHSACWKCRRWC